ncbi:MAG TPA: ParB/RepB/Spo0J family partition protein [Terriglobales bacterium]|nr:ParB/RepB/Spo0J family partition protein [Terriglobales bacterium]
MARPDFRAAATARLNEERGQGLSQNVLSLLSADSSTIVRPTAIRNIPVTKVDPNPNQPRMALDKAGMDDLTASVKEHGVLQPILVRPRSDNRYQLIAGERRWRAARGAGLETIPALIEDIDDETALEISVIENLQREDLSPMDEALIYDKMVRVHGYSIRRLAQKLGKDKGYLENRLRLADAPPEIRELVSVRKDTLSHAYELLKVADPKKRKHLAEMVARGELSLVKLREKIDGAPRVRRTDAGSTPKETPAIGTIEDAIEAEAEAIWLASVSKKPLTDDSLIAVRAELTVAMSDLIAVLQSDVVKDIDETDRQNLAKFLMIVRVRLENAIGLVRRGSAK